MYAVETWLFNGWHLETADGRGETLAGVEADALVTGHWPQEFAVGAEGSGTLVVLVMPQDDAGAHEDVGDSPVVFLVAPDAGVGLGEAVQIGLRAGDTGLGGAAEAVHGRYEHADGASSAELAGAPRAYLLTAEAVAALEGTFVRAVVVPQADAGEAVAEDQAVHAFWVLADEATVADVLRRNGVRLSDVRHAVLTHAAEMVLN